MLSEETVATATTIKFNSEVSARVMLCAAGIIEISVPAKSQTGSIETTDGEIEFLQFPRFVSGGMINFFVHTNDKDICGKKLKARAFIMRKEFVDGRSFLYVDLKPVPLETETTRRLVIVHLQPGQRFAGDEQVVIETPPPLRGAIVLMAPGPKVMVINSTPSTVKVYAPQTSEDPQLDRLIADGWEIQEDNNESVVLTRMKKGEPKTMTHHRPKKRN